MRIVCTEFVHCNVCSGRGEGAGRKGGGAENLSHLESQVPAMPRCPAVHLHSAPRGGKNESCTWLLIRLGPGGRSRNQKTIRRRDVLSEEPVSREASPGRRAC